MIRRSTLSELEPAERIRAVNAVYSGYLVPMHFSEAQLEQHVRCHDVALDRSPLWSDETGSVVALAMLGIRGDRGWVGGFGVVPERRGEGHGRALARALLLDAERMGLAQVQLEVLTANLPAIRAYERVGFERTRDLRILSRPADAAAPAALERPPAPEPADVVAAALLGNGSRPRAIPPCWQREPESLRRFEGLAGLALGAPDSPRAHAIYRAVADEVRIGDLAGHEPRDLEAIATALVERFPGRRFSILNEPEGSPVCGVLEALAFRETQRQHEMVAVLRADAGRE